jgi:DNA primase
LCASQQISPKYNIKANFEIEGIVEKSDVIGALFGQTEGLFGSELDLRELQKSGRIGRIEVEIESKKDVTKGHIIIPSTLNKASSSLIAATIESVDRVGPCNANVSLVSIEDIREAKRKEIISRAKEILRQWTIDFTPKVEKAIEEISESAKPIDMVRIGREGLSAGPEVEDSKGIIIVEGRADVSNLIKSGIYNAIACEGVKIPETIIKLSKEKEAIAFLDGDRGGDLILKELQQVAEIRAVARAPRGKEVEDLDSEEILSALKRKKAIEDLTKKKVRKRKVKRKQVAVPNKIKKLTPELKGTLEAVLLDEKLNQLDRIPVSDLCEVTERTDNVNKIVFDGVITQRLVDIASEKKVTTIIGDRISEIAKRPIDIQLLTFSDIEK